MIRTTKSRSMFGSLCEYCAAPMLLILGLSLGSSTLAQGPRNSEAVSERCILLELYLRGGQPESDRALAAANGLVSSKKGVVLVVRDVTDNAKAQQRLDKIAAHFHFDAKHTPVLYACNQVVRDEREGRSFELQLKQLLRMEVFTRQGCSRCAEARKFLPGFSKQYPGLEIVYREITTDAVARNDLNSLVAKHRTAASSTPVFHFCDKLIIGFDRPESTGARLHQSLDRWTMACPTANAPPPGPSSSSSTKPRPTQGVGVVNSNP